MTKVIKVIMAATHPDNIPAHQAMLRQVELSIGRPPDPTRIRPPGRPRIGSTKWTDINNKRYHTVLTDSPYLLRLRRSFESKTIRILEEKTALD